MFRNRVISSVVAASLMAAVSGFAFAADTGGAAQAAKLTKQQIADIRKECKEANKKDMKAFHKCVKEKEDATKSGT